MDDDNRENAFRLDVPITDQEQERQHSRDGSLDRLIDQNLPSTYNQARSRLDSDTLPPEPVHHSAFKNSAPHRQHIQSLYDPPVKLDIVSPIEQEHEPYFPLPERVLETKRTGYAPVRHVSNLWRPFWLRRLVLAAFVLIFALLLIALLILWYHADDDNGFGVSKQESHYTWTYAPTALLVIVVALWRQVDYYCKALAPYVELQKGPVIASASLLLDYISPSQIDTFIKAAKNGHWAVLASTTAFAFLKLMTIFATGLFFVISSDNQSGKRLRIEPISLWALVAGFSLLIVLSIIVMFTCPGAVTPQDPSSIGATAAVLARSSDLQLLLQKHDASVWGRQKAALAGFMFRSSIIPSEHGNAAFKIVTDGSELRDSTPTAPETAGPTWWCPWTSTLPFLGATFLFPIIFIVILEILQNYSDRHSGLLDLPQDQYSAAYGHYIPALIMLLVAALYNTFDFNISLFSPYSTLRKGNVPANWAITTHLLGKLSPLALLTSIRTRQVGAFLAIIAAMCASVLTILVSGLYTVEFTASSTQTVTRPLTRLDTFNPAWPNSVSGDSNAASILSLIEHNSNHPFAPSTYDSLAFPRFSVGAFSPSLPELSNISTPSTAILPALRANLKCTVLPKSAFGIATLSGGSSDASDPDEAIVTIKANLPASCHLAGTSGDDSFVVYQNSFELPTDGSPIFAGAQFDLLFGSNASTSGNYGEENASEVGDSPAVGCPSLAFTFGRFQLNGASNDDVTAIICFQQIERVNANVTFQNASTSIDSTNPPRVDEGSVALVQNPRASIAAGKETFEFRIQRNLETELQGFSGGGVTGSMDHFFQAMIGGREGVRPEDLVGLGSEQRLVHAITRLYQRYMALVIDRVMRISCKGQNCGVVAGQKRQNSGDLGDMQVTLTTQRLRLVQDKTSKLALQVLLGLMVGLGAVAWAVTKMKKLVPVNICTIAGRMSLLAGSSLCYSHDLWVCECCGKPRVQPRADGEVQPASETVYLPEGAEWMTAKLLDAMFAEARMQFSLGWWREKVDQGKQRRYGIDVGPRADGNDDQDWELGGRGGGVEGRGLGWGAFNVPEDMNMSGGLRHPMENSDAGGGEQHGGEERFQRFKSLRGPGGDGRGVHGRLHEEEFDEEEDNLDDDRHPRRNSDARRVRWAAEDEVRVYGRPSEDAASSVYSGQGYGHDPNSFRRRSEIGRALHFGGEA